MTQVAERLALTREEFKKYKEADADATSAKSRAVPIYLRFVILFVLVIVFTVAGALVGYSVMGHGNPVDVLKGSAFFHIYDLVEKK
jgi:hypothetical protein